MPVLLTLGPESANTKRRSCWLMNSGTSWIRGSWSTDPRDGASCLRASLKSCFALDSRRRDVTSSSANGCGGHDLRFRNGDR